MQAEAQAYGHVHGGDRPFLDIERVEHQQVAAMFGYAVAHLHHPAFAFRCIG